MKFNGFLTKRKLSKMNPGIFATGSNVVRYTPDLIDNVNWVAVKGDGQFDWAIYIAFPGAYNSPEHTAEWGSKLTLKESIKGLIPCDSEALEEYRF